MRWCYAVRADEFVLTNRLLVGTRLRDFQKFHNFEALVIVWLALACVTDILITGTLVNYLVRLSSSPMTNRRKPDKITVRLTEAP